MQVDWKKYLTALNYTKINEMPGALQHCPLHPSAEPSLKIQRDYITHDVRFLCQHDRCYFSGDAVTLLSMVKKITITQALETFKPDGALYHTLENTIIASHVEEFQSALSDQVYIAGYFNRCQQTFRTDSAGPLRALMSTLGTVYSDIRSLESIPRTLGMLVQDDIPQALREFSKSKYRKGFYAVYPYTFEQRYTCVRVQNFSEQAYPSKELVITRAGIGIFMEDHLKTDTTEVIVANNELTACTLHHKLSSWVACPPAIIALAGLPLPFHYKNIKKVILISFNDAPLTLRKGLQYFVSNEVVEGLDDVELRVTDCNYNLHGNYTGSTISNSLEHNKELGGWIIERVAKLLEAGRSEEIYDAFNNTSITTENRTKLLEFAEGNATVTEMLKTINGSVVDQLILATGNIVRRTPNGFQAIKANGTVQALSNVVLDVVERIRTEEGIDYLCKIQSPDYAVALTHRVTSKDLRTADALQMSVDKAFVDAGLSPYVAFYHIEGYTWPDILSRLSSDKRISKELTCLGVDADLQVQFPNIIIDTIGRRIIPQSKVIPIPSEMKAVYSGLIHTEVLESLAPMHNLIELAHNNVYLAGLLAGICHITGQLHKHLLSAKNGIRLNPSHLFYISANIADWLPIFQQLAHLFSDTAEAPMLAAKNVREHLAESGCLGDLPWIVNSAGLHAKAMPGILDTTPSSLITCLDYNAASGINDRGNCAYAELNTDKTTELKCLHHDSVLEIRNALPGFFLEMMVAAKDTLRTNYSSGRAQAVVGYSLICNALRIPVDDLISDLVKPYYVDKCFTGCHELMNILHKMFMAGHLQIVNRMPDARVDTNMVTRVFTDDNVALINKKILRAASHMHKPLGAFREVNVTADLQENNYLVEMPKDLKLNPTQFWALDKAIWDTYVRKEPIMLPLAVESGQILKLERIA